LKCIQKNDITPRIGIRKRQMTKKEEERRTKKLMRRRKTMKRFHIHSIIKSTNR
jgi:hypothetical protein